MNAPGLCKELRGVVFGEEDVIDDGGDLDTKPLGKLAVLYAEILYLLLLLDFGKQLSQAISLDNITSEPIITRVSLCQLQ